VRASGRAGYGLIVPSWDADAELTHPVDFRLVHNSFVTLFWSLQVLGETVQWLRDHGYDLVTLDASAWNRPTDMMAGVGKALHFPDYFGRSLDALNDCMRDVASGDYGVTADATGLALVLLGFDAFETRCPDAAHALLDIYACQARNAALIGRRMMCLVQSNDPHLTVKPVGATPVGWNDAEFLATKRGG
jgi:hypothetical protein